MHDLGRGAPADKAKALGCYRRAWRLGDLASAINIATIYREQGKRRQAFQWLAKAAEAGEGEAWIELAMCYRDGHGVRADAGAAVRCLSVALGGDSLTPASREQAEAMLGDLRPRLA